jgi:hypothetical protein
VVAVWLSTREHTTMGTMAAVGFAGLLVVIMRSDEVKKILYDLVMKALTVATP